MNDRHCFGFNSPPPQFGPQVPATGSQGVSSQPTGGPFLWALSYRCRRLLGLGLGREDCLVGVDDKEGSALG